MPYSYGLPAGIASGYIVIPGGQLVTNGVWMNTRCAGEPGLVEVDCNLLFTSYTTDDANPATLGGSTNAKLTAESSSANLGQTGGFVVPPSAGTTTNGATPGGTAATGSGTCVYANGTTPTTALCSGALTLAGVNVARGDASANVVTNPNGCITAFGNPCWMSVPAGAGAQLAKGDSYNDTVVTTVLGTTVRTDFGDCYGYNMPHGTC